MSNVIMQQRICAVISQTYALDKDFVWTAYQKINSFDIIIDKIERKELSIEIPVDLKKE
jgi:hypothetical protein